MNNLLILTIVINGIVSRIEDTYNALQDYVTAQQNAAYEIRSKKNRLIERGLVLDGLDVKVA